MKKSTKPGSVNGFILELFIYEPVNQSTLSISNGVHLIVHNQTKAPSFYEGLSISPGTQTNVEVQRVFSSHLDKPYSDCHKDINSDYPSKIVRSMLSTGYAYNQRDCFFACFQQFLVKNCSCYDFSSTIPVDSFIDTTQFKPCLNQTGIKCAIEV